jgi:hypothetical protein
MRFFKENSGLIVKLFINQIGIAIFAFMLYTAAGSFEINDASASLLIKVILSAFSMLFYFTLIYNIMWEIGGKDKIRIDSGRAERKASKGLMIGLFANAINIIVVGVALLLLILNMITGLDVLMSIFAVLNAIFRIFVSMYLGVIMGLSAFAQETTETYYLIQTAGFLVFSFISAFVIHFSYLMGLNDKRIFPSAKK